MVRETELDERPGGEERPGEVKALSTFTPISKGEGKGGGRGGVGQKGGVSSSGAARERNTRKPIPSGLNHTAWGGDVATVTLCVGNDKDEVL